MAPEWPGHDIAVKSSGSDFLGLNPGSGTRQLCEVGHVAPRVRAASLNALWLYGPLGICSAFGVSARRRLAGVRRGIERTNLPVLAPNPPFSISMSLLHSIHPFSQELNNEYLLHAGHR